ncbi:MAG: hypothetical protein AB7U62_04120 [Pseudolabrys sp.]
MSKKTYFVAQGFEVSDKGRIKALPAQEMQSAAQADRMARSFAVSKGGGLAFSRDGDPTTGDYDDAVVIGRYGHVPEEQSL